MGSPLVEDFSDAAAFVQEDTSYAEQNASEDEVERKIAEEHAKFKEAYARRQEEVRASRPWSAPPVESPRPEQQKERERERKARGSIGDGAVDAPRAEYEPPVRPYLLPAQASGNTVSYLSRPQSAEHRTAVAARAHNGPQPRVSLSGIEEEAGEGMPCDWRQASEMGRLGSTFGEGTSNSGGAADDAPGGRASSGCGLMTKGETEGDFPVQVGAIPEVGEEEEEVLEQRDEEEVEEGLGKGDDEAWKREGEEEEERQQQQQDGYNTGEVDDPRFREPSAEEVIEDEDEEAEGESGSAGCGGVAPGGGGGFIRSGDEEEEGEGSWRLGCGGMGELGDEAGEEGDGEVLLGSREGLGATPRGADHYYEYGQSEMQPPAARDGGGGLSGDQDDEAQEEAAGEEEKEEEDRRQPGSQRGDEGPGGWPNVGRGPPSVAASSAASHSLAMRGFVEPLAYDASFGGGGGSAGRRSPAVARRAAAGSRPEEEDEEEDYYDEDTFEDDEEPEGQSDGDEEEEEEEKRAQGQEEAAALLSGEHSLLRASVSASKALLSSSSVRSRVGATVLSPLPKEPSRTPSVAAASASTASLPPPPALLYPGARHTVTRDTKEDDDGSAAVSVAAPPTAVLLPSPFTATPPALPSIFKSTGSGVISLASDAVSAAEHLSARSPMAPSHTHRSISSNGSVIATPTVLTPPPAPSAALSELQPSQQFALQLLKHDIEVLPQHHRAAAEAAAARRKSSTARPVGASLAAFGYLGYHMVSEKLTAPSGPGFRSGSPGRGASPGRGDSGVMGSPSLVAVRSSCPAETAASVGRGGRPTSAPHMRPSCGTIAEVDDIADSGEGGGGAAAATVAAAEGATVEPSGTAFVEMAREMRAGRMLPLVAPPPTAAARGGGVGCSNCGSGGGADGAAVQGEQSLSIMGESEMNAAVSQSRIKFDVWLDALSSGGPTGGAAAGPSSNLSISGGEPDRSRTGGNSCGGGGGSGSYRPPRPMTAPASGRRRPVSARPTAGAGLYMPQPATVNVPKPLARPMSAQPHHLRPLSASLVRGSGGGGGAAATATAAAIGGTFDAGFEPPVAVTIQPPDAASAAGGTAAVEVGGVTVSVYVADTLKRIVEANRWLQQLGVATKRYRLKDRFSNMTIQLVEELPPLPSDLANGVPNDGAVAVVKELTLKQFLSGHSKLKQQAKKLRSTAAMAAAAAAQQQQQSGGIASVVSPIGTSGMPYMPDYGAGRRPISASFGSGSGAAGLAAPNSGRVRPASAIPYSGGRSMSGSADPSSYGAGGLVGSGSGGGGASGAVGHGAFQMGRPARPSSANPAYGRTSTFISYSSGSPPAVPSSPFMQTTYAVHAAAGAGSPATKAPGCGATAAAAGGFPQPRAAWGAVGNAGGNGYQPYQGYPVSGARNSGNGSSNGLPYMHRSIPITPRNPLATGLDGDHLDARIEEDNGSERAMMIEPDEQGDVSRVVRQQLGSASDYCQARRQEIARLRTLPLA